MPETAQGRATVSTAESAGVAEVPFHSSAPSAPSAVENEPLSASGLGARESAYTLRRAQACSQTRLVPAMTSSGSPPGRGLTSKVTTGRPVGNALSK